MKKSLFITGICWAENKKSFLLQYIKKNIENKKTNSKYILLHSQHKMCLLDYLTLSVSTTVNYEQAIFRYCRFLIKHEI